MAPLQQLLDRAVISITHDIIHRGEPQVLAFKITAKTTENLRQN